MSWHALPALLRRCSRCRGAPCLPAARRSSAAQGRPRGLTWRCTLRQEGAGGGRGSAAVGRRSRSSGRRRGRGRAASGVQSRVPLCMPRGGAPVYQSPKLSTFWVVSTESVQRWEAARRVRQAGRQAAGRHGRGGACAEWATQVAWRRRGGAPPRPSPACPRWPAASLAAALGATHTLERTRVVHAPQRGIEGGADAGAGARRAAADLQLRRPGARIDPSVAAAGQAVGRELLSRRGGGRAGGLVCALSAPPRCSSPAAPATRPTASARRPATAQQRRPARPRWRPRHAR